MKDIQEEHNKIRDEINQAGKAKVFIVDRVQKLEDELIQYKKDKETLEQSITQLEKDKKAFATAKRFKDAGRCQAELKDNAVKKENIELQVAKTLENKDQITKDMEEKTIEMENLENSLIEIRQRI